MCKWGFLLGEMVQQVFSSSLEEFTVVIVNPALFKVLPAAKYLGLVLKEFIWEVFDGVNPHVQNSSYFTQLSLLPQQMLSSKY